MEDTEKRTDAPRATIEELERLLDSPTPLDIEIQPDGSILAVTKRTADNQQPPVLTAKRAAQTYY